MDPEVSDYDEDIIPPYSPLSEYINNDEVFDSKIINKCDKYSTKGDLKQSEKVQSSATNCHIFSYWKFVDAFKLFFCWFNSNFMLSFAYFYCFSFETVCFRMNRFTHVLVSEDLSMLLNYESQSFHNCDRGMKRYVIKVIRQIILLCGLFMLTVKLESIVPMHNITDDDFSPDNLNFLYLLFKIFLLCAIKIGSLLILLLMLLLMQKVVEIFLVGFLYIYFCIKIQTTECIIKIFKKCLRFIQEAELIARGFTSASVPGIVERIELSTGLPITSPQRQHPELRKYLFMWTKQIFMLYRVATQKLFDNSKFDPVTDFASTSMASLDLKEFGNFFRYNIDSDIEMQELLKCSDNLSVSSLKTMYLLAELQVSEFYKYMYLKITFVISDDNVLNIFQRTYQLCIFIFSLFQFRRDELYIQECACKVYKYYSSLEMLSDNKNKEPKIICTSPLEINVHNMSLHLKSALKRLTDLEEIFEASKDSHQPKILKKAEVMFKEINSEIVAYEEYYKKCSNELQNILYGEKKVVDNFPPIGIEKVETVKTTPVIRCDIEPDIQDEIFEAITTQSSFDCDSNLKDYPVDNQRNIEAAGKLLQELKNVLVVKADEHRAREQVALAKKCNIENLASEVKSQALIETVNSNLIETVNSNLLTSVTNSKTSESSLESDDEESIKSDTGVTLKNLSNTQQSSFAASIASLALQRQKMMGISNDVMFFDGTSSDDEEFN